MFRIIDGKGFYITLKNGYTVSVQFGYGNYCDHHHNYSRIDESFLDHGKRLGALGSSTAEIAIIKPNGEFYPICGNDVSGYQTPEDLIEIINMASNLNPKEIEWNIMLLNIGNQMVS